MTLKSTLTHENIVDTDAHNKTCCETETNQTKTKYKSERISWK